MLLVWCKANAQFMVQSLTPRQVAMVWDVCGEMRMHGGDLERIPFTRKTEALQ